MPAPEDIWARVADEFVYDHYSSVRGRVRTHVVDANLARHLAPPPGRIADVGGGAGTQSIPLARRGYDVTILDSSPAMLERAAAALASEPAVVTARVTLVEDDGVDAVGILGVASYDAAFSHAVIPYLDDPEPMVAALSGITRPSGIVSIIAKSRAALAVLPALHGQWKEAIASFDGRRQINQMGLETRADTVEDLSALLAHHGVEPIDWYGVRLFTDGWSEEEPEPPDIDDLLAVELEASRRDPYRQMSRLFHLVGRKA